MKKKQQPRFLVYTIAVLTALLITFLAIWQETWYRIAVLGVLILLSVGVLMLLLKLKKLDAYIRQGKTVQASSSLEEGLRTDIPDFKTLVEKEKQLDVERTQIFEELLSKTQMAEQEKVRLREKMTQADTETSRIRTEWLKASDRLSTLVQGTKRWLARDGSMQEVASVLDPVILKEGTFAELNREIGHHVPHLSKETLNKLKQANYVDDMYQLTRSGYKALKQASSDMKKQTP